MSERTGFPAEQVARDCVDWIRTWFEENGKDCVAVVGISGGKDSSVVAALCVEALGAERVLGVLMPQGEQWDIDMSHRVCDHLGIRRVVVNIGPTTEVLAEGVEAALGQELSRQSIVNLPARIRMATLYAVSQTEKGRVANTCNLSEDWVGYSTRYGDMAGDFSPLSDLVVREVKAIGRAIGLPEEFIEKTPIDGLSGLTDEENLGFSYEELDRYIREGVIEDPERQRKIDALHRKNRFKTEPMPKFIYRPGISADLCLK
ncbi:MAG: NAD(+) synthase [Bacillota bacterium]|nr:NAD(+) synthase [Bacillota bacterium]